MNKSSIINSIRGNYIDEFLESSKVLNYTDLKAKDKLTTALYEDLPNTTIDGYPIASNFASDSGKTYSVEQFGELSNDEKEHLKLRYYYLPYSHELYVGATGSGKTTGCVEPQIRAISYQKNKPNLFVSDPKGELFDHNAQHLIEQGYKTYILNFKDLIHSDKWNPLLEIYEIKMKILNLGKNLKMREGLVKKGLILISKADSFSPHGYLEYEGNAFSNGEDYENYIQIQKDYLEASISTLTNQLSTMIVKDQGGKDKTWENGAQEIFKGIIYCMLEDAANKTSGFTRDMMNLKTVKEYYNAIKTPIYDNECTLNKLPIINDKSKLCKQLLSTAFSSARQTMQGFCSVFESATKDWFQGHIFSLTTGNTINLDDTSEKPFAIFLITRDYDKSDFLIAGLFVDWVYRQMLEKAENSQNPKTFHFLLDEFGNIPEIKDLENKIATARSRNIWFHLFIQSYAQIDKVYGKERAEIIRDNCNSQIFLGSQNRLSKEIFSSECGKHNIPTLESRLNPLDNSIREVPLIPISDLDLIKPGQMYNKRLYMPVITTQFIRSYICANIGVFKNFTDSFGLLNYTPVALEPFTSDKFTYKILSHEFLYESDFIF